MARPREITAIVEGQEVKGFISGSVQSSLITAVDSFVIRIPRSLRVWNTLRRDAHITIRIDGVPFLDGFIDRRQRSSRSGVMEIHGRDRSSRLQDESAPAIDYTGLTILEAAKRLTKDWFGKVTSDNARNRRLRRGKGRRVAAPTEPVITINVRVPRQGQVHPGESRMHMLKEIASRARLIVSASADGTEFFIGKPNQQQAPQYTFVHAVDGSKLTGNVRDLTVDEDDGDRYSVYVVGGVGGQNDLNFGKNIGHRGVALDNPFNPVDGTGRDFIHPKRMYMPERAFESFHDAQQVAEVEKARRDYKRHVVTIEADDMGQYLSPGELTFFAPDTVARVIDEDHELDDNYFVVGCNYNFSHDQGDWTTLHMVPTGTEILI